MSPRGSARTLAAALWLGALSARAQGTVQDDPRRPPPPQATPGCEIWEGTIVGNDPSAIAYFQLCGEGTVTGIFLFTSLRSGWSRHRIEGTWNAAHTRISLRDLAMEESHPLAGWTLCPAETYDLAVTRTGHIDGTFDSTRCNDHGQITLDLTQPNGAPAEPPRLPPPPTVPPVRTRQGAGRTRFRCESGACVGGGGGRAEGLCAVAMVAAGLSARRRRPARR